MRLPKPKINIIDRVITAIDPKKGLERYKNRVMLEMAASYTGASKSRRSTQEWVTSAADADADINWDLPLLRERSRDLIRNAPLAAGAINTKVTNVIGTGLRLQSKIDSEYLGLSDEAADAWQRDAEREFKLWADSQECDIERTLTFTGIQELAFRSVLENGDVFVLLPYQERVGSAYGTRIQLIEADRVSNPSFKSDTREIAGGVERDIHGAPVAYYILETHPGAVYARQRKWIRREAFGARSGRRNVLHLFRKIRIGQTRGVPDLAPVIETLKQLDRYTEAEVTAAVVSALFTVFIKKDGDLGLSDMEGEAAISSGSSSLDYKLGSGAMLELAPGEDVVAPNPGRPNQAFDPFVMAILRQIGVALELPFEVLIKHFTASYSASRAALLEAWKFFTGRRIWMAQNFCQPIYEAWLTEAVLLGRIQAPGFLDDPAIRQAYLGSQWVGPARGQIDELKEINAARERVIMGVSTLEEVTEELTAGDWEVKHRQRVKEEKLRKDGGLLGDSFGPKALDIGSNSTDGQSN